MSKSPKQTPADRDELLASEFALGVLSGKKLETASARFASDPAFTAQVDQWHSRLSPMLNEVQEVAPSPETWNKIENLLFVENTSDIANPGLFANLAFWRGLSFATSTLAALLFAIIFLRPDLITPPNAVNDTDGTNLIAALNLAKDKPTFIIQMDQETGQLQILSANFTDEAARVPELWLIPEDGVPRSLGVISANDKSTLSVDSSLQSLFKSGATLAVSLEPEGGAPDGKPTGPIVALGKLLGI